MWIKKLILRDYRAFQKECAINLSRHITAIAGTNGVGKSTILAVLTNVGELKEKTLSGSNFRGEFSKIIMYDSFSDTTGKKASIFFEDLPNSPEKYNVEERLDFRASVHSNKSKKRQRYRLIPVKTKTHDNERKVRWPSTYLGLSRLSPLGESSSARTQKIPPEISDKILKVHSEILSENLENDTNASMVNIDIGTKHPKVNITSENYGFASNSNGQDNTGQIIEAVLSFEMLKKKLGPDYIGGILAIDELDASLHPAAQNKLADWLLKMSQVLDLQIVFTTHSLTLLEHLSKQRNKHHADIMVNYLSSSSYNPGVVKIKENPPKDYYRHNLQETYSLEPFETKRISCFTEDKVARWYFQKLVALSQKDMGSKLNHLSNINYLDISTSWRSLLSIYNSDPERYSNDLFLLDPDLSIEHGELEKYITSVTFNFKVDTEGANIYIIPGTGDKIETQLKEYLCSLSPDHDIFDTSYFENNGITFEVLHQEVLANTKDDKKWYRSQNKTFMDYILKYWYRDNKELVHSKLLTINNACAKINASLNN